MADLGGGMSASCTVGQLSVSDGRIMCCSIINSWQSAATSETVKCSCS